MTPQKRLTIIKKIATTGNVIESAIAQNLLDTFYDDSFVLDYLSHLTTVKELSVQTMSEVLGSEAESFYKKHQNNIDSLVSIETTWKVRLSTALQNEITNLINSIEDKQ